MPFQQDQGGHDGKHGQSDLRRRGQVGTGDPGRIDRHGQRLHAQEFGCADIVQGFQQGQAQSDRDGGACQGQGDAPERRDAARAQRAGRLQHIGGLRHEHGARRQVDIGIQRAAQHENGARQRAQFGQPELPRAVIAQQRAEGALHWPDRMQQIQVGEGDDVGGYGQRQQQRPAQDAPSAEFIGADQPRAARAQHRRQHAHAQQQQPGVGGRLRQHVVRQVRPMAGIGAQRLPSQRRQRGADDQRDQCRAP